MNIQIKEYQPHLLHASYIIDAIDREMLLHGEIEGDVTIEINDLSMSLASGYGTWRATLTLTIDGTRQVYSTTHHNEGWYYSQKMVYEPSRADSEEELNEAYGNFQMAYETIVNENINKLVQLCIDSCEQDIED